MLFFNVRPGNKDTVAPNPSLRKNAVEFTTVMTNVMGGPWPINATIDCRH